MRIQNYGDHRGRPHPPNCTCWRCNEERLAKEAAEEEDRRVAEYDRRVAQNQEPGQNQPGRIRNLSPQQPYPAGGSSPSQQSPHPPPPTSSKPGGGQPTQPSQTGTRNPVWPPRSVSPRFRNPHLDICQCPECKEQRARARPKATPTPIASRGTVSPARPPARGPAPSGQSRPARRPARSGLKILLAAVFIVVVALLLFSVAGCGPTSADPDSPPSLTPSPLRETLVAATTPSRGQGEPEETGERPSAQQMDCVGQDFIKKISPDYAANPIRAKEKYVGQRLCFKGTISSFITGKRGNGINVAIGESGVSFALGRSGWGAWAQDQMPRVDSQDLNLTWNEWLRARSVGDTVEAECEIYSIDGPNRTAGKPVLADCKRVVKGVLWTPTPIPTPTFLPCAAVNSGDPHRAWLNIDCSGGKVTVGVVNVLNEFEGFQTLSAEGPPSVSLYFIYNGERWTGEVDSGRWKQRAGEPQSGDSPSLVWEAPPDAVAFILSEWRQHNAVELGVYINGECCVLELSFPLTHPLDPPHVYWRATPAPTSTPVPTLSPTPTSTAVPTPTLTPTPTLPPPAQPTSLPLAARFINMPDSHDGDVFQLWLQFTEPVTLSYKTLRDQAIQAQNGTATETKRWDGRSDLWRVTVEPDGNGDVVITLKAPAGCDAAASVCTESGKALSNSPTVSIPYQQR